MRNTSTFDVYKGEWWDGDSVWTDALREELDHPNDWYDGTFFVPIERFSDYFGVTAINIVTNYEDNYLMLDDQSTTKGTHDWCGERCTKHEIEISSDIEQDVYFTLHTWHGRDYPFECIEPWTGHRHVIYWDDNMWCKGNEGSIGQLAGMYGAWEYTFKGFSGSKTITVELDWTFDEDMYHDWGVVVQAKDGPVHVRLLDENAPPSAEWHHLN